MTADAEAADADTDVAPGGTAGPVVVLHGAPRSGKTSIAAAVAALDGARPWVVLGVETSRAVTPGELQPGLGLRPGGERPDVEAALPGLTADLFARVAAASRGGSAVLVDVPIHEAHSRPLGLWAVAAERLAGLPAWLVAVRADAAVVHHRRAATGYPTDDDAVARWQAAVPDDGPYDLVVDTTAATPEDGARLVLRSVAGAPGTALSRRGSAS